MSVTTKFDIVVQKSVDEMSNLPLNCDNFTLENSFLMSISCCQKASRIIQICNINFYTWVWPPSPLYTMCKKTSDLVDDGFPYLLYDLDRCGGVFCPQSTAVSLFGIPPSSIIAISPAIFAIMCLSWPCWRHTLQFSKLRPRLRRQ